MIGLMDASSSYNSASLLAPSFVARRSQTYGYAPSSRLARGQNPLPTYVKNLSDGTLVVIHVLAIDRHRGSRSFGRGRLFLGIGATGKGEKRKRGKAGVDQVFHHINGQVLLRVEQREFYGAVVVVVVVFLTTTLVATILSPSCV